MTSHAPHTWSIVEMATQLANGSISAVELAKHHLARIKEHARLNAFLHVDETGALAQARSSDERRAAARTLGPLDGIPVAHKDALCTEGIPTTAGSRILEGYRPPYDATVVQRWKNAGTVMLGKLNMDEFAMGSSNENSAYGPVLNPRDETRIPGGSSGGSAAAVAAGLVAGATGTDTGGSIRQPAALCGVVGVKPTYGRVSRYGVVAYASSLDQVGPLARTVPDAALLLQAMAGHDARDSTSANVPVPDFVGACSDDVKGLRIGVPREFLETPGLDEQVKNAVVRSLDALAARGATLVDIELPNARYALATYYVLAPAEASSNLSRYDGIRYGPRRGNDGSIRDVYEKTRGELMGREVKRRIALGTFVLSAGYYDAYYARAQKVRALIKRDFDRAFERVDVVASPTAPTPAFKLGEKTADPVAMYLSDIYTLSCNLAGLPGISVPCGMTTGNTPLPIGIQFLGQAMDERSVLRTGHAVMGLATA